jgi:hypothetical protein
MRIITPHRRRPPPCLALIAAGLLLCGCGPRTVTDRAEYPHLQQRTDTEFTVIARSQERILTRRFAADEQRVGTHGAWIAHEHVDRVLACDSAAKTRDLVVFVLGTLPLILVFAAL